MARSHSATVTPFDAWAPFWALTTTGTEMALASAQTIGHRLNMMAGAGHSPNARQQREFLRMGSEKMEAAFDSARAMSGSWNVLNRQLAAMNQAQTQLLTAFTGLTTARNWQEMTQAQQHYWEAFTRSSEAVMKLWVVGLEIAQQGLLPIHAKATANARRLGLVGLR